MYEISIRDYKFPALVRDAISLTIHRYFCLFKRRIPVVSVDKPLGSINVLHDNILIPVQICSIAELCEFVSKKPFPGRFVDPLVIIRCIFLSFNIRCTFEATKNHDH